MRTRALRRPMLTRCSTTIASSREAAHRIAAPNRGTPLKGVDHLPRRDFGDDDVGHGREAMVRGAQEHAAQAHEVARDREIDHLPAAVGQQLVRARPALLQDERVVTLLALVDDLGVRGDRPAPRLEPGKARQLILASAAGTGSAFGPERSRPMP